MNIRSNLKNFRLFSKNPSQFRSVSTESALNKFIPKHQNGSLALVSTSNNIYYNLALENFIAESVDLKNRNILLIWVSDPCIVFGRHQNPWLECNVKQANLNSVKLARRYSGGGCVYHDLGNLNISFLTDRLKYDRKFNLTIIKDTLDKCNFNDVSFEITPRHDIFVKTLKNLDQSFKISGSAARLAQKFSYHHCTLLFDADINNMKLLRSNLNDRIITKATPSVRSKCINLKEFLQDKNFNLNEVIIKLCQQFWRLNSTNWGIDYLFNYINPENEDLAQLYQKNINELQSWQFMFGSTPKFQLNIDLLENRKLSFTIANGEITEYQIDDRDEERDKEFIKGLDLFIKTKLDRNSLVDLFLNTIC